MKKLIYLFLCMTCAVGLSAQYTYADTLRGSILDGRDWWDLTYYHLDIDVDPADSTISGSNTIQYKVLKPYAKMQVDLQPPLQITKITQDGEELQWESMGNAHFVALTKEQITDDVNEIIVHYEGRPHVAQRAPWDGGISWKKDETGRPFVASSCQGIGASIWWPCKDHMADEVDSLRMTVTSPKGIMNVGNGRLVSICHRGEHTTTEWVVKSPINNYGVNINVGDYVHFGEKYEGEGGTLDMDYYVIRENLEIAKEQFKQGAQTIEAFEHWFGPYPFYTDGFKLVQAPYLGMEHQSSVTYGNGFKNGYLGRDLSGTGWGLKFDYIIIHETGHEWFANNITYKDIADMWIHESFTTYSEGLFVEYWHGKAAGAEYIIGQRRNIQNDRPIIGPYGVNGKGSGDMYFKGSNILHTIRQIVADDDKWRMVLRGLNKDFYHQTVTTQQIEDYMSQQLGVDLDKVFDQYLRDSRVPVLEYRLSGESLAFRWSEVVDGFDMPIEISVGDEQQILQPTANWQEIRIEQSVEDISIDPDYYVRGERG